MKCYASHDLSVFVELWRVAKQAVTMPWNNQDVSEWSHTQLRWIVTSKEQIEGDGGNKHRAKQQRERQPIVWIVVPGGRLFFYILQEISDDICFLHIKVDIEPLFLNPYGQHTVMAHEQGKVNSAACHWFFVIIAAQKAYVREVTRNANACSVQLDRPHLPWQCVQTQQQSCKLAYAWGRSKQMCACVRACVCCTKQQRTYVGCRSAKCRSAK